MTIDEKLAAVLAAVQTDPGRRGLANLFTACPSDFAAACRSIAEHSTPTFDLVTGFFIPRAQPPAFETDGPLGAVFLARAFHAHIGPVRCLAESGYAQALRSGLQQCERTAKDVDAIVISAETWKPSGTHLISIERVGPASDGRRYSMRGIELTNREESDAGFGRSEPLACTTIGIGDGGNEIGMGKIPHDIVAENIPNGDRIHCRIATDYLIVAGISNWGAYALAAGVYVLRGILPPDDLYNPDREYDILKEMVQNGPLVDGVTALQTVTVDGLNWNEYIQPMIQIRDILESP